MNVIRWDPFDDMHQLWEQVNQLFEQRIAREAGDAAVHAWAPAVDIAETPQAILLYLELPGVATREIDIQIVNDTLTVKGQRSFPAGTPGQRLLRSERQYGPFQRSFTLGVPITQEEVTAGYRDGVLVIMLPKRAEAAPKQVKVEVTAAEDEHGTA